MGDGLSRSEPDLDARSRLLMRLRFVVLVLLGAVTFAALSAGPLMGRLPGLGFSLKFLAMLVLGLGIAFFALRQSVLAAAAALAPLPGAAFVFCGAMRQDAATAWSVPVALVYALGFGLALIIGERFAAGVADGKTPDDAAIAALRGEAWLVAALVVGAAAIPALLAALGPPSGAALATLLAWTNAAALLGAYFVVPLAGSIPALGEDFIVRTNRLHEAWARALEPLAIFGAPPWDWSGAGILMVFLVLAVFGSARLALSDEAHAALSGAGAGAGVAGALLLAALATARSWRRGLGLGLAVASVLPLCAWGYARAGALVDTRLFVLTAELAVLALVPAAVALRPAAPDALPTGSGPSGAPLAAALAALVLLAPWFRDLGAARLGFALGLVAAAAAAAIFAPALAGAIEGLFPRRVSLSERYRVK